MRRGRYEHQRDDDIGLHALNFAWSLGFERAFGNTKPEDEQSLNLRSRGASAAMRDQYHQGIKDGRALRATLPAEP